MSFSLDKLKGMAPVLALAAFTALSPIGTLIYNFAVSESRQTHEIQQLGLRLEGKIGQAIAELSKADASTDSRLEIEKEARLNQARLIEIISDRQKEMRNQVVGLTVTTTKLEAITAQLDKSVQTVAEALNSIGRSRKLNFELPALPPSPLASPAIAVAALECRP